MSSASQTPMNTIATALRSLQLTNARLESKNRQLSSWNVELEAETRAMTKRVPKGFKTVKVPVKKTPGANQPGGSGQTGAGDAGSSPAETEDDDTKEMNPFQCGKYFICAGEIWVHPSFNALFASPLAKPEMAHDDPDHYKIVSPELTVMGAHADLYHLVPEKLHDMMGSNILFQGEFRRGMKDGCSTFVSVLRKQMPSLLKLDASFFEVEHPEMRRWPEVEKYLKFDLNDSKYPDLPPILFPDLDDADSDTLFQNKILITALGVLLRGGACMRGSKHGTPGTNCQLWGVSTITGPMIATTATIIIHLLSLGGNFSENNDAVDLYRYHQFFKHVLVSGRDLPHFKEMLRMYQDAIFGGNVGASEHIPLDAPREKASNVAKDLLRRMQAKVAPVLPVAPAPPPVRSVRHEMVPHQAASSPDSSSSGSEEESSGTESGSESESAAMAAAVGEDQQEEEEEEEEEETIELDEEVGGTDYDEVYANPVSAPTSAGRTRPSSHSVHCSVPPISVPPISVPAPDPSPTIPPPALRRPAPVPVRRPAPLPAPSHAVASEIVPPASPLIDSEAATVLAQDKHKKRSKRPKEQTNATDVAGGNVSPATETAVGDDVGGVQGGAGGVRAWLRDRRPPPSPDVQSERDAKAEKKLKKKDRAMTKSATKPKKVVDDQ